MRLNKQALKWSLKIFLIALSFCLFFSVLSELVLAQSHIFICAVIIFIFIFVGVVFDIVGVSATSCNKKFLEECMNKNKRGAKTALFICNHSDKISSFCCDIVGDICGILSGSALTSIVIKIAIDSASEKLILSVVISSFVAAFTVFLKALGKGIAVKQANKIVLWVGGLIVFKQRVKTRNKNGESS